jgi:hypothetical protein
MPYRRLPTTDKARSRALKAALKMAEKTEEKKLAFSKIRLQELNLAKTNFENSLTQYEADRKKQAEKNKEYKIIQEKTVLYISHFILTLYMAVERDEIKEDALKNYNLQNLNKKLPRLASEDEILNWGKKIIDGEQKRIQSGGSPIYTPSVALVKVNLEKYKDIAIFMQNLRKISARSHEKMKESRNATNLFISQLWNEIEENLKSDSPKHKRQQAQEYGIIYIFRRKEKKKLKSEDLQTDLLFDFS